MSVAPGSPAIDPTASSDTGTWPSAPVPLSGRARSHGEECMDGDTEALASTRPTVLHFTPEGGATGGGGAEAVGSRLSCIRRSTAYQASPWSQSPAPSQQVSDSQIGPTPRVPGLERDEQVLQSASVPLLSNSSASEASTDIVTEPAVPLPPLLRSALHGPGVKKTLVTLTSALSAPLLLTPPTTSHATSEPRLFHGSSSTETASEAVAPDRDGAVAGRYRDHRPSEMSDGVDCFSVSSAPVDATAVAPEGGHAKEPPSKCTVSTRDQQPTHGVMKWSHSSIKKTTWRLDSSRLLSQPAGAEEPCESPRNWLPTCDKAVCGTPPQTAVESEKVRWKRARSGSAAPRSPSVPPAAPKPAAGEPQHFVGHDPPERTCPPAPPLRSYVEPPPPNVAFEVLSSSSTLSTRQNNSPSTTSVGGESPLAAGAVRLSSSMSRVNAARPEALSQSNQYYFTPISLTPSQPPSVTASSSTSRETSPTRGGEPKVKTKSPEPTACAEGVAPAAATSEDKVPSAVISSLSEEQMKVLRLITQENRSVFITGEAGTGKSHLLRAVIQCLPLTTTFVTATTGIAALNLGGTTLHSFSGCGLVDSDTSQIVDVYHNAMKTRKTVRNWRTCSVLIVDEVSMLDGWLFDALEQCARRIRGNNAPFGGIQLVLSGDFLQLPPVKKRPDSADFSTEWSTRPRAGQKPCATGCWTIRLVFEAQAWCRVNPHVCVLQQQFRQRDGYFFRMLNELRVGEVSMDAICEMRRRASARGDVAEGVRQPKDRAGPVKEEGGIQHDDFVQLRALRATVNKVNVARFAELDTPIFRYRGHHCGAGRFPADLPDHVELRVGCQVMLLKNINLSLGLGNGSLGTVVSFRPINEVRYSDLGNYPIACHDLRTLVREDNFTGSRMAKAAKSKRAGSVPCFPVVSFFIRMYSVSANKVIETRREVIIEPQRWTQMQGDVEVSRSTQIPLQLAYAITIHKSQGMSLSHVNVDFKGMFEEGQAYVALSRCTNLENLIMDNFNLHVVNPNPRALAYYYAVKMARGEVARLAGPEQQKKQEHPKDLKSLTLLEPPGGSLCGAPPEPHASVQGPGVVEAPRPWGSSVLHRYPARIIHLAMSCGWGDALDTEDYWYEPQTKHHAKAVEIACNPARQMGHRGYFPVSRSPPQQPKQFWSTCDAGISFVESRLRRLVEQSNVTEASAYPADRRFDESMAVPEKWEPDAEELTMAAQAASNASTEIESLRRQLEALFVAQLEMRKILLSQIRPAVSVASSLLVMDISSLCLLAGCKEYGRAGAQSSTTELYQTIFLVNGNMMRLTSKVKRILESFPSTSPPSTLSVGGGQSSGSPVKTELGDVGVTAQSVSPACSRATESGGAAAEEPRASPTPPLGIPLTPRIATDIRVILASAQRDFILDEQRAGEVFSAYDPSYIVAGWEPYRPAIELTKPCPDYVHDLLSYALFLSQTYACGKATVFVLTESLSVAARAAWMGLMVCSLDYLLRQSREAD